MYTDQMKYDINIKKTTESLNDFTYATTSQKKSNFQRQIKKRNCILQTTIQQTIQ